MTIPWGPLARAATLLVSVGLAALTLVAMHMVPGIRLTQARHGVVACDQLPGRAVPSQGTRHLPYLGAPHAPYNSSPPTPGPHLPWIVSVGVYREPIADEFQVHLLEHGDVLIQYPVATTSEIRDRLEGFARWRPDKVLVAPNPAVHSGVALTAWQRIDLLAGYTSSAFAASSMHSPAVTTMVGSMAPATASQPVEVGATGLSRA
jgi:Protein of unknown function (DUF3105)